MSQGQVDGRPSGDVELLGAVIGSLVLLMAWTQPLWGQFLVVPCPFREFVGLPCPTCGGVRALVAAAHGRWLSALGWNPVVGLLAIGLLGYVPWATFVAAGACERPRGTLHVGWHLRVVALVVLLANWAYLLIRLTE